MANCDPNALANAARCFLRCVPSDGYQPIRAYTLCQIASTGLSGGGGGGSGSAVVPAGFQFTMQGVNLQSVWTAPPAGWDSTELWTSSDNVTFALQATVAAPGASSTYAWATLPNYAKIRYKSGASTYSDFTQVQMAPSGEDWGYRVVANGGADPSAATKAALSNFITSLATYGLVTKFYTINALVPDSLTAATTPLINYLGLDPWVNNGPFVGGDLTVNGLIGDGASKYFNLGFGPQECITSAIGGNPNSDFGIDVYCSVTTATNSCEVGSAGADFNKAVDLYVQFGGTSYWDCPYNGGSGRINVVRSGQQFTMGNRTAANAQQMYGYTQAASFNTAVTGAVNNAGATSNNGNFYAFRNNQAAPQYSDKRLSYIAIRKGLSLSDANTYAGMVQVLRVALGGGYI